MAGPLAPSRGALRVVRGSVLAITSAALAVLAHVLGGGMPPSTGLTLLLTIGAAAGGVALADRQRGGITILAALGTSHLAIHELLTLCTPAMDMGSPVNAQVMLAAHVAAILLAAVLLARAERAIYLLAALLAMLLPRWIVVHFEHPEPAPAPRCHAAPAPKAIRVLLRRVNARRGPPVTC
ncbi:MAG TPA: hypothetical protein VG247_10160 [Pseudonocardiaceae bacterium]|nr:hypothetical protein [Pseudonocardiaceae bacterium]